MAAGTEILMPKLSDGMEEGTIVQWLVSVGGEVSIGDELVEIEADKATVVYRAEAGGTLVELAASEGEALSVGELIARLGDGGDPSGPDGGEGAGDAAEDQGEDSGVQDGNRGGARSGRSPGARPTPLARRSAELHGIDLSSVEGSGIGGRVLKADVLDLVPGASPAAAEGPSSTKPSHRADPPPRVQSLPTPSLSPASAGPDAGVYDRGTTEIVEPSSQQRTMAVRMQESKATVPHFYLSAEVDVSACVEARSWLKGNAREGEPTPTFNDIVVKACATALRELPQVNAAYRDQRFERYSRINVGVAVAAGEVLLVPTLFDADQKGLREIATETRALAERVADGSIGPTQMSSGTFTVSNLGMYGIREMTPVINAGQAAILGVGAIAEATVERERALVTVQRMILTFAGDHRILTGVDGARFLARVRALLEAPLALAL